MDDSELSRYFAARGGRARALKLSETKRRSIARKAGRASGKARRKQARMTKLAEAAALLGRRGGLVRSKAKKKAAPRNGSLGGRPRTYPPCPKMYGGRDTHKFTKKGRCPCGYVRTPARTK